MREKTGKRTHSRQYFKRKHAGRNSPDKRSESQAGAMINEEYPRKDQPGSCRGSSKRQIKKKATWYGVRGSSMPSKRRINVLYRRNRSQLRFR